MSVNKENMRKVTQALRSDRYKQGKFALRVGDSFCASGVACDASGLDEWVPLYASSVMGGAFYSYGNGSSFVPADVLYWLGVPDGWMVTLADGTRGSIPWLNDNGVDFHEIAALIEKEYEL